MKPKVQPAVQEITVRNLQRKVPVKVADLSKFAQKAAKLCLRLPRESKTNLSELREISVLIVSDRQMASLHRQFMNESGPTDVIDWRAERLADKRRIVAGRPDFDATMNEFVADLQALLRQIGRVNAGANVHPKIDKLFHRADL